MLAKARIFASQKTEILVYLRVRKMRTTLTASGMPACKHAASISLLARLAFLLSQKTEILVHLHVRIMRTSLTASGIGRAATAVAGTQWRQWSGSGTLDSPTPRQRGDAQIIVENYIFLYY